MDTSVKQAWTAYWKAYHDGDVAEMAKIYDERIEPLQRAEAGRRTTRRMCAVTVQTVDRITSRSCPT